MTLENQVLPVQDEDQRLDEGAEESEHDSLDDMIEDSFPASDPPSYTPVTAVGPTACDGAEQRENGEAAIRDGERHGARHL